MKIAFWSVAAVLVLALALLWAVVWGPLAPSSTPPEEDVPVETPAEEPEKETEDLDVVTLPGDCRELFDDAFIAEMESRGLPLNDPALSMVVATFAPEPLALLDTVPTLRCTWGVPSEVGVFTHVSIVTPEEQAMLLATYEAGFEFDDAPAEFDCTVVADDQAQTRCVFERVEVDDEGRGNAYGEIQMFRGDVWITTRWINAGIDTNGYTDEMVRALWG